MIYMIYNIRGMTVITLCTNIEIFSVCDRDEVVFGINVLIIMFERKNRLRCFKNIVDN